MLLMHSSADKSTEYEKYINFSVNLLIDQASNWSKNDDIARLCILDEISTIYRPKLIHSHQFIPIGVWKRISNPF